MHLQIVAVGRLKSGPERDLAERYRERAMQSGRNCGFSGPDIFELNESRARRPEDRKAEEAEALAARLGPHSGLIMTLDERGKSIGSEDFAKLLGDARDAGKEQGSFIIGGADGLDAPLRNRAALVLSFGALTLPHQLVRVLVLEQVYRAITILSGHPYHRI